jgi:hypothetical protein
VINPHQLDTLAHFRRDLLQILAVARRQHHAGFAGAGRSCRGCSTSWTTPAQRLQ